MGNSNSIKRRSLDISNSLVVADIREWMIAVEKSLIFVWCDASIGTQTHDDDQKNTILQLAQLVNKNGQLVHTFNDLHTCQEFITHVNNVCLITSGSLGEQFVPLIHNLSQIHSIYIFCFNKQKHELWAKNYAKVRDVCTDIRSICESLKTYIISQTSADYDRTEFDIISSEIKSPTIDKHELPLIYAKLSKIILLNMDSSDHGKQDMINYLQDEYTSDYQIQLINDFERNYSRHNPIWWYTRNCFFQGIINRALRSHDLYALCSMHRFIKDMDSKLVQLHTKQKATNESLTLYFAQFLLKKDFQHIQDNHEGLMCINQFISVNSERSIAVMFLKQQNSSTINGNKIRVLFQIHINRTIQSNVSYANIASVSEFVHEKEYLISFSSIFRINKVEKLHEIPSAWLIQLTLIERNDLQYNNLTQYIQAEQLDEEINLPELGYKIKNILYPFKSANTLFKHALDHKKQEFRAIMLHYNMAVIYDALSEYEKSLDEYRCALNIARDSIPTCHQKDDLCLVPLYSNMALAYEKKEVFSCAYEHAFRALQIVLNSPNDSILLKELESSCYCNLGSIHDQHGKFISARNFYGHALKIRQEYLPLGHPDITVLQNLITLLSAKTSESD